MNNKFHYQSISYNALLRAERISFKEDEKCLNVGTVKETCGFVIFISSRTLDTPGMLKICLPLLKQSKCPFRLIKNQNLQYRLNSGTFGNEEAGKVVSIFPATTQELEFLTRELSRLTSDIKGPVIAEAQRIDNALYLQKAKICGNEIKLCMPLQKNVPVPVPLAYRKRKRKNAILSGGYLPVQSLRSSAKGNIYKAINLKRLAFNWCLIKQGNPVAFDDHFDRDMKDRLLWQKEVISKLQAHICTPGYIDYFEAGGSSYLVLDYAEGESLGHHIRRILSGTEWVKIEIENKERILGWFLQAVSLIETIHQHHIVHRDITDSNFILLEDGRLCIIDFELSYSLKDQRPDPPFLLGTFGYASPEQLQYFHPDEKDDIYALGALLAYVISGCPPHEFLNTTLSIVGNKLARLTGSKLLAELACRCLKPSRKDRPTIADIKDTIYKYLDILIIRKHETFPMAV